MLAHAGAQVNGLPWSPDPHGKLTGMDEGLRRRAREARAAGQDPAAALAAAAALLRAGQQEAAWEALVALPDEPAARALLGGLPAWTHSEADPGRTRFLDVAPLTTRPRVRWSGETQDALRLLVGPGGVVWVAARAFGLLDPGDGRALGRPGAGEALAWIGQRLLVRRGREVLSWDPGPGPPARDPGAAIPGLDPGSGLLAAGELLLELRPERLRALRLDGSTVWEHRPTGPRLRREEPVVGGDLALVQLAGGDVVRALDLASGEERFAAGRTAARADAAGIVAAGPRGQVLCLAPDGLVRWSAPGLLPLALAPEVVVVWDEAIQPLLLERASGAVRAPLGAATDGVALARGVVYWWRDAPDARLGAVSWRGEPLWDLALPGDPPRQVLPLPGRVLVLTRRGAVVCLEAE